MDKGVYLFQDKTENLSKAYYMQGTQYFFRHDPTSAMAPDQNDSITQFYRHHERERGIEQQWQNQREMLQVRLRERTIYNRRQAIRQRLGINVTKEELDSWIRSQH